MKKFLLLLFVTLTGLQMAGHAQTIASYNFAASTGTYSSIASTSTTTISNLSCATFTSCDDNIGCSIPIGFSFVFCGTTYTSMCVSDNGVVSLAGGIGNGWYINQAAITGTAGGVGTAGWLFPFWDDLYGQASSGTITSTVYYQTTGTTPNRVCTVEWKNFGQFPGSSSANGNFQLKLYEGTNCVEFCYGSSTFTSNSASIGIANSPTAYQTLNSSGTSPTSSTSTFTTSIATAPASGQVYRWCPCPVSITASNNGPTCSGGSIVITGTTTGISYTWTGPGGYSSGALVNTLSPITPSQAGTYTLTASNGSCTMAATTNVNVVPTPTIIVTPSTDTICLGASTVFTVTGTGVGSSSTIVSQNFNTGMTGSVGGTWTITNLAGTAGPPASYFQLRTPPGYTGYACAGDGSQYMECAPDATTGLTHTMVTSPSFSTIGFSSVSVSYNHYYYNWWSTDIDVSVEWSIDGGTTWGTPLVNYYTFGTGAGSYSWTAGTPNATFALPAATLCQPDVKLRWRYNGVWGYIWAIDNIVVSGTPMTSTIAWTGSAGSGLTCTTCNPNTVTPGTTGLHTYTLTTSVCGCSQPTVVAVYVNALTTSIAGTPQACIGTSTTLTNATTGGSWSSSNTAVATVGVSSGIVTGATAGTTLIDYCMPGGCCAQTVVTVFPTPSAIGGSTSVCTGNCTTLTNTVSGGTWSSSNPAVATIDPATGVACGVTVGSAIISYGFGGSCYVVTTVNVYAPPTSISGSLLVCVGTTSSLAGSPTGGLWSIPASGPSSGTPSTIASVGITNGVVSGLGVGTATISYRIGICAITRVVTVVAAPGPITSTPPGVFTVCQGNTLPLSNSVVGGSWSSGNIPVATVNSSTGLVLGQSAGTAVISYLIGSTCYAVTTVTVTAPPSPIIGDSVVCIGSSISLSHAVPGGTWLSGSPAIATVSSTGSVTGALAGTTIITYTVPSGCIATKVVTVVATPTPPTGSSAICQGTTTTLASSPSLGTWVSSNPAVGTIGSTSGIFGGVSGGTTNITYSVAGCTTSFTATVNPTPIIVGGTSPVCQGYTTSLAATPSGGTWSSSDPSVGTVDATTGVVSGVSGGTTTITFVTSAGCSNTKVVTVNGTPTITGTPNICIGLCTTFTTTSTGGTWSSSNPAVGSITPSGIVCGSSLGTTTISYISPIGCAGTRVVTVSAIPSITGLLQVCIGANTTLGSSISGGTWSSSNTAVATIDATTGVATGIASGTTTISYLSPSGCTVMGVLTVDPLPTIGGSPSVCAGQTSTLTGTPAGGTWTVGAPSSGSVATIGLTSGVLSGSFTLGTTTVTYTAPSTFCRATVVATVSSAPTPLVSSTGSFSVCANSSITVSSTPSTGTWTVTPGTGTASITTGGVLTGTGAGTVTVGYSIGGSCVVNQVVTVYATPAPITGSLSMCVGSTGTLTSSAGVTWTSSNPSVAPIVGATGAVTAVAPGTTTITGSFSSGCSATAVLTVNALPPANTGILNVCIGQTTTLSNTAAGTWSCACPTVATVNTTTGVITGVGAGTCMITMTAATGCKAFSIITVNALPTPIGGPSTVCVGTTVTMTSTPAGGSWSCACPGVATIGSSSGAVTGVGVGTCEITYTVGSGCFITKTITVNSSPSISGPLTACQGMCTGLSGTPAGGTWSVTPGSIATVSSTGNFCGVATGSSSQATAIVSYTNGSGCSATQTMTVNPLPGVIAGSGIACIGACTNYSCTPTGGTWSIFATSVATVNPTTGDVCGVNTGTAMLTYTVGSGCFSTLIVTVHPSPLPITGASGVCMGTCTTLSSGTPGGTWISGSALATIDPVTGYLCGSSSTSGTTTITYMVSTGCTATRIQTVHPLPTSIGGSLSVCQGFCATMSGAPAGGTWSISPASVATVNPTTGAWCGVVTGATSAATATVTYTSAAGCVLTSTVTVNAPPAISGFLGIALGGNTTLTGTPGGGTWTATPTGTVTVTPPSTSGIIHGGSLGTGTVTYTLSTGCSSTTTVTVNPVPSLVDTFVCKGYTMTYPVGLSGGTWSSSNPGVGTINTTTGLVGGITPGTATITYTMPTGTSATATLTVYDLPAAIGGTPAVCVGLTTTLTNATTPGTWSSSNTTVATISSTGVVSGLVAGTTIITYTSGHCFMTQIVTVNPLPSPITGSSAFCNFSSTTLSSLPTGGTWSVTPGSGSATIDPSTGVITGASQGSVLVTYTLSTGCIATTQDSVIFAPYPITGPVQVCLGSQITLGNVVTGGVWTSSSPSVAPVGTLTGIVDGLSLGTSNISYTISTGCSTSTQVTVNPLPGAIAGVPVLCEAATTTLFGTGGGTWASGNTTAATIDTFTGVVTGMPGGGTATISYILPTGCFSTVIVTVNALPTPIAGSLSICYGNCSTLSSTPAGGNWWSSTGAVNINFTSGVACGMAVSGGTSTITYTLPSTGCYITAVATVYPMPSGITGPSTVCELSTITLSNSTGGGLWVSSNPSTASVDATTGVVTGNAAGVVTITYQMPSGCSATKSVTVNASPTITGALQVCAGFNTNLVGTPTGGSWATTPGTSIIGTVNPLTGVVTGISGGTTGITYTLTSGCRANGIVTVNDLPPAIGGTAKVCVAATTTLTNFVGGGTWSSSNPSVATVTTTSLGNGAVTGVSTGTVDITFTAPITGCINTRQVTVNPLPAPIAGTPVFCGNAVTIFTDATAGGSWISSDTNTVTVLPMGTGIGQVHGVASGNATITYQLTTTTGCYVTKDVTVSVTPPAIAGTGHVCIGTTVTLTNTASGGVWSSTNPTIAPVTATGVVSGLALGTSIIAYTLPGSGCAASKMVTVQPLPTVYSVTGGGSYCSGGPGVHVGLNGSQIGVSYALYYGASATGYMTGTNLPIDFGLMTLAGVYTVQATNAVTGCTRNMSGSANVVVTTPSAPVVSINSIPGDTVCPGTMATVSPVAINGGTAPTYVWKVNGVTVSTAPAYSFIPADGDVVNVTMTSNSNCVVPSTATTTKVLHVAPSMMPTVGMVVDPGDTVCQYSMVTYMATPDYGGSAPSFTWLVNGTTAGAGPVFSYVPNDGDDVKVRMTSNYICRLANVVESGTVSMVVDSMIVPHIHVTPHPGYAVDSGTTVTFTTSVTDAGTNPTYQWYINGVPVLGATNDSFATSSLHHYDSVTCRVTSSGICHDVSSFDWAFISVSPLAVQHINAAADIRLIPNPNNGTFTVKGTWGATDEDITLEVTNMIGQVVYSGKLTARNGKVNESIQLTNTLANGMYMLNMRSTNETKVFHFVMEQ